MADPIYVRSITPGKLEQVISRSNGLELICENGVRLICTVWNDQVIRLRYTPDNRFPADFSYAISNASPANPSFTYTDKQRTVEIKTKNVRLKIDKKHLRVSFYNAKNRLINQEKKVSWTENVAFGGYDLLVEKSMEEEETFFGLGDKPVQPNLAGKRFQLWGTDSYAYGNGTDPLYKNIPFFMGQHRKGCYGIFFDNSFRSFLILVKRKVSPHFLVLTVENSTIILSPEMTLQKLPANMRYSPELLNYLPFGRLDIISANGAIFRKAPSENWPINSAN